MATCGAPFRLRPTIVRAVVATLATVAAGASLAACRQTSEEPAPSPTIQLRVSTVFAPLSTRLMEEYRRTLPGLQIEEVLFQPEAAGTGAAAHAAA